ncbi:hypothetical protein TNCV_4215381 [Trichonephila clavipes]|nr:hypothetical protein TNCV_4215381 [Trichonephila clavipes]
MTLSVRLWGILFHSSRIFISTSVHSDITECVVQMSPKHYMYDLGPPRISASPYTTLFLQKSSPQDDLYDFWHCPTVKKGITNGCCVKYNMDSQDGSRLHIFEPAIAIPCDMQVSMSTYAVTSPYHQIT